MICLKLIKNKIFLLISISYIFNFKWLCKYEK